MKRTLWLWSHADIWMNIGRGRVVSREATFETGKAGAPLPYDRARRYNHPRRGSALLGNCGAKRAGAEAAESENKVMTREVKRLCREVERFKRRAVELEAELMSRPDTQLRRCELRYFVLNTIQARKGRGRRLIALKSLEIL